MVETEKKEGQLLILATILGIALPLCNVIAVLLGLAGENPMLVLWPGYVPLLVYMIGQEHTIRDFMNIVCSGLVGIATGVISLLIIHATAGMIGELAAMFVGTFICIFVFSDVGCFYADPHRRVYRHHVRLHRADPEGEGYGPGMEEEGRPDA